MPQQTRQVFAEPVVGKEDKRQYHQITGSTAGRLKDQQQRHRRDSQLHVADPAAHGGYLSIVHDEVAEGTDAEDNTEDIP